MGFRLRAVESPVLLRDHFRALLREAMGQLMRDLVVVTVTNHVILEYCAPQSCQTDTPRLDVVACAFNVFFGALLDQLSSFRFSTVVAPSFIPVAVGAEDSGDFPCDTFWSIEGSGEKVSRPGFEVDLFGSEVAAVDLAVDDGGQWVPDWFRKESNRDFQVMANPR